MMLQIIGSVLSGGAAVHFFQFFWISKKDSKTIRLDEFKTLTHEDRIMREEMRLRMSDLETAMKSVRQEVDDWREKYFKLLQEHSELQIKYTNLKADFHRLKRSINTTK